MYVNWTRQIENIVPNDYDVSISYKNTYEKTRFDAVHWNSGHGLDDIT